MAEITYSKPTWANTTTPAISASNLQAMSDALDKAVHVANRGGALLDADTVSGYGIGVATEVASPNLDNYKTGGLFGASGTVTSSTTINGVGGANLPTGRCAIEVIALTSAYVYQRVFNLAYNREFWRYYYNGTWYPWYEIFSSFTDGNGGQPPAPKPTTGVPSGGGDAQGQQRVETITGDGSTKICHASGSSNLTGNWDYLIFFYSVSGAQIVIENILAGVGSGIKISAATLAVGKYAFIKTTRVL